jgi:hypothetical protein
VYLNETTTPPGGNGNGNGNGGVFGGHGTLGTDLVSYWRFDGDNTDAHDAHDLTAVGAPGYVAGHINQCCDFDGLADGQTHANHADFNTLEFSVSLWMRVTDLTPFRFIMGKTTHTSWDTGWGFVNPNTGAGDVRFFVRAWNTHHINAVATLGTWQHWVLRCWDGGGGNASMDIWRNGASQDDHNWGDPYVPDGNPLTFAYDGNAAWLEGRLDEIGYWDRRITNGEIADLYNGGSGLAY